MDEVEKITKRVTDLESSLMHIQSDVDSLNEIVLDNVRRLDKLVALIQHVTDRLDLPCRNSLIVYLMRLAAAVCGISCCCSHTKVLKKFEMRNEMTK